MKYSEIFDQIKKKQSYLCIGLDTDIDKIPEFLKKEDDPIFEFNKIIIDATHDLAVSYKPNTAFYECLGTSGWKSLEKTAQYIKKHYPELFLIADAKRGDIGNTSKMYAKAFFENMNFDAITVSPYMGSDAVIPYLEYHDKWVIILGITSNKSAVDLQVIQEKETNEYIFEKVLKYGQKWGTLDQIMFVAGATQAYKFQQIRKIVPDNFLLVPGVGAQGGDLNELTHYGINKACGLLVNSSRGIIYAGSDKDFDKKARESAKQLQQQMSSLLLEYLGDRRRRRKK